MTFQTIPQMFFEQAARHGERCLLMAKREGAYRETRWSEVQQAVEELAIALIDDGVAPENCVAILAENRPEWAIADLAIQTIGGITVPIYPTETAAEVAYILQNSGAVAMVVSTEHQLSKVLSQQAQLPQLRRLILCEPLELHGTADVQTFAQCLERGRVGRQAHLADVVRRREAAAPSDTMTIIYTSGTTGTPKGVMLSHGNFLSNCMACSQALDVNTRDVHLSFLPLSHVFERMAGLYLMIHQGATIAYAEGMDQVPGNLLEVRPTILMGVPRFYEKLYTRVTEAVQQSPALRQQLFRWALRIGKQCDQARQLRQGIPGGLRLAHGLASRLVFQKLQARLGGRVRFCVSGSAPLAPAIAEFFAAADILILEGYGLTESSPVISVNRLNAYRFGSVGQPIDDVEVRIAEDGEILTRGPHVMQGYYHNEAETAATVRDGWLHTGDIGQFDAEGFLHITDRKKDLIKTAGGKMVAPQKVENLLVMDPYIQQAFVFGDRQRYVVALIVPQFEVLEAYAREHDIPTQPRSALVAHPEIHQLLRARIDICSHDLASYACIKQFAVLEHACTQAAGELTPTLKARRAVLCEKYAAILERLYAAQPPPSSPT